MQTRQRARAAAAARLSSLAEQVLHVCALELQRHLQRSAVGALRLVCRSACAVLDASMHKLHINFNGKQQDRVQPQSTDPGLQRLLANCGRRWPAVRTLVLQGYVHGPVSPVSLAGCTLPPHLETIEFFDSRPALNSQSQSQDAADPLSSLPATLQSFKVFHGFGLQPSQHCQSLCQALSPALPGLQSLTSLVLSSLVFDEQLCGLRGALLPGPTSGTRHGGGEVVGLFAALSALQALTRLELQGQEETPLGGLAGWAAGGEAQGLSYAEASLAPLLSQPLAASLHHLTRLEVLVLGMPIYRGGAERLAPALQRLVRLRELSLCGCELGMPAERVHLSYNAGQAEITEAVMAHSGLGALGGALAALTALTRLGLDHNGPAHFITALPQSMPQLRSLDLSIGVQACYFYQQTVVMVAATLRRYPSLTALNLWDNPVMAHSESTALVAALAQLTNLRSLYLGGDAGESLKVAASLTPALQHLRQLEDLSLSGLRWPNLWSRPAQDTQLSLHGGSAPIDTTLPPFWCAVAELTALTNLDLSHTAPTSVVVSHMAQVLPQLTNLQSLDISNNDLDDRLAIALAPALSHLVRLTELQAGNRLWGVKGMEALLRSVAPLTRLQVLVLRRAERIFDDECSSEDEEGKPDWYDGFSSEEPDSYADWSSEDVERELSSAGLKGKQWEGAELTPCELHRLVPAICQLKALKELRLVCCWHEVAHERDIQAVMAALPSLQLDCLFM